eukprot:scaffold172759_cov23-Cyclotella_meneghiniana.AAC.1
MSLENKQYIFVAYDYTTNAIIVRAIPNREAPTIVNAFEDVFSYLESKGFKPKFNVLDNEASTATCARTMYNGNSCPQTSIESMPRKEPSKHLKITSSQVSAQPTATFHFNFGISSYPKPKTRSTCYAHHE